MMGKRESRHLMLCNCKYFEKKFTEMFLEVEIKNQQSYRQLLEKHTVNPSQIIQDIHLSEFEWLFSWKCASITKD